jgi:hypothetical protein
VRRVSLVWKSPGNVSPVTYAVGRSTTNGGPYATVVTGLTGPCYVDTAVTTGTAYYYLVWASDASGSSAASAQSSAAPQ